MLSKNFKPAKCKTSLKLAVSRIKLLRNKRENQIKQMRRELAQLIENGQEQTARIRVEHVIREEKTSAAYELIELFCELLAARIPIIDSQKYCPVDLKEAVATVIFASPRCSDIPELMDIRKHFAAKYGKEFTNAALEIRPDCGVSRLVIEKLSARAPDIETKIKTLKAIAEDHNVKWDSTSFEEQIQKPHEDLLNGPTSFAGATKYHTEQYSVNPSPGPNPAQINVPSINIPHTPRSESRTSGGEDSYSNSGNAEFSSKNQTAYTMEFQNATLAAQAAAESAERASIAARAAARFASRENMSRQTSTRTNETPTYDSKYEKPENLRVFLDEYSIKEPAASVNYEVKIAQEVKPKVQSPHVHEQMQRNPSNFSSNSSPDFVNDDILGANFQKGHSDNVYFENNSSESKAEDPSPRTVKHDNVRIKYDDDVDSSKVESYDDVAKDKDVRNSDSTDHENYEEETFRMGASIKQSSFTNSPAPVFDNYNHVDESSNSSVWRKNENLFDTHLEEESSNYHSSASFNDKTSAESFAKPSNSRLHLFTESHAEEHSVPSLVNVSPTPAFDASDEESTDIEDQVDHKIMPGPNSFSRKSSINSSFADDKNNLPNQIYVGETKEVTKNDSRLYERKIEADPIRVNKFEFSSSDEEEPQPQRITKILPKEKPKSSASSENLSDEKQGINFSLLTGGLKHKSIPRPPYVKRSDPDVSDSPIAKEQESFPTVSASQSKTKYSYFDSPESDNDEHLRSPTQDSDYPRSQKKAYKEVNSSSLGAYSDSDDDKQYSSNTVTRKINQISPVKSTDSNYNTSSKANASVKLSRRTRDVIPATRNTSPKVHESKTEQPPYEESSKFKQVQTPSHEGSSKSMLMKSLSEESPKFKQVQTSYEESSKSMLMKSLSEESLKSTGSGSNEDSVKKASRTHPKLPPDYDTFAAHFHALRSNKR